MKKQQGMIEMNAIRAIVPAVGRGKRLQKINGDLPEAMAPVGGHLLQEICQCILLSHGTAV